MYTKSSNWHTYNIHTVHTCTNGDARTFECMCHCVCVIVLKNADFFLSSKSKICTNADTINLYLLLLTTSFMISSSLLFDDSFGRSNTSGGWEADGSWSLAVDWPDWEPALLLLLPVLLVVVDIFTESATIWRCWCHDSQPVNHCRTWIFFAVFYIVADSVSHITCTKDEYITD